MERAHSGLCCGESGGEGVGPEGGPVRENLLRRELPAGGAGWVIRALTAAALLGLQFVFLMGRDACRTQRLF